MSESVKGQCEDVRKVLKKRAGEELLRAINNYIQASLDVALIDVRYNIDALSAMIKSNQRLANVSMGCAVKDPLLAKERDLGVLSKILSDADSPKSDTQLHFEESTEVPGKVVLKLGDQVSGDPTAKISHE
jgi:hypothetical protein